MINKMLAWWAAGTVFAGMGAASFSAAGEAAANSKASTGSVGSTSASANTQGQGQAEAQVKDRSGSRAADDGNYRNGAIAAAHAAVKAKAQNIRPLHQATFHLDLATGGVIGTINPGTLGTTGGPVVNTGLIGATGPGGVIGAF